MVNRFYLPWISYKNPTTRAVNSCNVIWYIHLYHICNVMLFILFFSTDVAKLNIIYIKLYFNEIDQLIRFKTAKQWIQVFVYVNQHIITKFNKEVHVIFRLYTRRHERNYNQFPVDVCMYQRTGRTQKFDDKIRFVWITFFVML